MQAFSRDRERKELGKSGEEIAAKFLQKKGYRILERNYRCRLGEIDLVAKKSGDLLFVEVKTRRSSESVSPPELVDFRKQRQISRAAQHYLAVKKCQDRGADFAVLIIDWSKESPSCELIENAFFLAWGY